MTSWNHTWSERDIEVLRSLWGKMSAAMIAERIAPTVTKSAVLGKAHYLDLPRLTKMDGRSRRGGTPHDRKKGSALDKQAENVPKHQRKAGRNMVPRPDGVEVRKPLEPTGMVRTCQWPIGNYGERGFRFCGDTPVVPGRPYCAQHMMVAYLPPDHPAYDRKKR